MATREINDNHTDGCESEEDEGLNNSVAVASVGDVRADSTRDPPHHGMESTAPNYPLGAAASMSGRGGSRVESSFLPGVECGAAADNSWTWTAQHRYDSLEEGFPELGGPPYDGMEATAPNHSFEAAASVSGRGGSRDGSPLSGIEFGVTSDDDTVVLPGNRHRPRELPLSRPELRDTGEEIPLARGPARDTGDSLEEPSIIRLEDWEELCGLLRTDATDPDVSQPSPMVLSATIIGAWLRRRDLPTAFVEPLEQFLDGNLSFGDGNSVGANVADCILRFVREKLGNMWPRDCKPLHDVCERFRSPVKAAPAMKSSTKPEEPKPKKSRGSYMCSFCRKPKKTYLNGKWVPHGTCPRDQEIHPYPGDDAIYNEPYVRIVLAKDEIEGDGDGDSKSNSDLERTPAAVVGNDCVEPKHGSDNDNDEDRKPAAVALAGNQHRPRPLNRNVVHNRERNTESKKYSCDRPRTEPESIHPAESQQQPRQRRRKRRAFRSSSDNGYDSAGEDGNGGGGDDDGDDNDDIYKDVRRHSV
eukprot:jgi/Psemu1/282146/fgenesh1_pg.3_\